MFDLNYRQIRLLHYLMQQNEAKKTSHLAELFSVSPRTIRNDLKQIKQLLSEHNMHLSVSAHGIRLNYTEAQLSLLIKITDSRNLSIYDLSHRELQIEWILLRDQHTTFERIAQECGISRQTVINSIESIEAKLASQNLKLNRKRGRGIALDGREIDFRRAYLRIFSQYGSTISDFSEETKTLCQELIQDVEKTYDVHFTNRSSVLSRIAYSVERCRKGHLLKEIPNDLLSYAPTVSVKSTLPDTDSVYIAWLMEHEAKKNTTKISSTNNEAHMLAGYLYQKLQVLHPINASDKDRFINGLTTHLQMALYRLRNHVAIQNSMLDNIQISIPLIYEYTKQQLLSCESSYGVTFSEQEIAYIAMYVASAFEVSTKTNYHPRVLVVCSFGTTTSTILAERLTRILPDSIIIGPFSYDEAREYVAGGNKADLVISTTNVAIQSIPTIYVSPLLEHEQVSKISNLLYQMDYDNMCSVFTDGYSKLQDNVTVSPRLSDFICENSIQVVSNISHWQDAIKLAAQPLVDTKKITEQYVQKMIRAVVELGTYMVLAPNTAFVHAGSEDGISQNCYALLIIQDGISFGEKNTKLVYNIVVLGVKDREKTALLDLVPIFANKENRELLRAKSTELSDILKLTK